MHCLRYCVGELGGVVSVALREELIANSYCRPRTSVEVVWSITRWMQQSAYLSVEALENFTVFRPVVEQNPVA